MRSLFPAALLTERSDHVYRLYGARCVVGVLALGRKLPHEPTAPLHNPLAVLRHPRFTKLM
ncbi:hypothetical protein [Noviherbaspirillum saxi]|uniref:Uncharacterized protein n=1 Tax=Noviherbaspirillum saxi TaxID=2320863 RepID=A0A3A3G920_9BURK|nr:hypothetical protein [Noviherbaspirillum saxi]RJF97379.1 hypothetical protein D3871_01665 [Noviherbaspirillum saxi]